jgi:alpha-beta hydrolase superfamily lysophospholipase
MLQLGRQAYHQLAELKAIPTLMLAGGMDTTVSLPHIRAAARRYSWVRYREFAGSKHVLTVEPDREAVFEECLRFMRQHLQRR